MGAEPGREELSGVTAIVETALFAHTASFTVMALGLESGTRWPIPK
jgi:hypothetical protein